MFCWILPLPPYKSYKVLAYVLSAASIHSGSFKDSGTSWGKNLRWGDQSWQKLLVVQCWFELDGWIVFQDMSHNGKDPNDVYVYANYMIYI